jgi:hypothetical protein
MIRLHRESLLDALYPDIQLETLLCNPSNAANGQLMELVWDTSEALYPYSLKKVAIEPMPCEVHRLKNTEKSATVQPIHFMAPSLRKIMSCGCRSKPGDLFWARSSRMNLPETCLPVALGIRSS